MLMMLLRAVQRLAWHEGGAGFAAAVDATSWGHRVAVLVGAGLLAGLGGWLLRRSPGRHAGDLAATIWFHAGRLPFLASLSQGALSITLVALGASLGRESAPKQAGAAFGSLFATHMGLSASHTRLLAAFGAGAGIAAVYDVPLGGGLFALELLLGSLALPLVAPALMSSGLATGGSWLMLPDRPTYSVSFDAATMSMIAFAAVMGPLAGVVSAGYVRLIAFADQCRPKGISAVATPMVVFAALGLAAVPLPELLGNGKDVAQAAFTGGLAWPVLLAIVVLKPIATGACLGSGAPGGLFTPTICFGAALGSLAGLGWSLLWPGNPAGAYAMVTAAAVLAAATRGPVSAVVLMLELTRRLGTLMVPVLIAVGGAMLVVRFMEPRSLYSCRIHDALKAADAAGPPAISVAARYVDLLRMLPEGDALPLRAIDEQGQPVGAVSFWRARHPHRDDGPLATATAGDFVDTGEKSGP